MATLLKRSFKYSQSSQRTHPQVLKLAEKDSRNFGIEPFSGGSDFHCIYLQFRSVPEMGHEKKLFAKEDFEKPFDTQEGFRELLRKIIESHSEMPDSYKTFSTSPVIAKAVHDKLLECGIWSRMDYHGKFLEVLLPPKKTVRESSDKIPPEWFCMERLATTEIRDAQQTILAEVHKQLSIAGIGKAQCRFSDVDVNRHAAAWAGSVLISAGFDVSIHSSYIIPNLVRYYFGGAELCVERKQ